MSVNQIILCAIIIISLIICACRNTSYFNILKIIKEYLMVFKEEKGYNLCALYISLILPIFLTTYTAQYIKLTNEIYEKILLVITILTALFFSALGIILTIKEIVLKIGNEKNVRDWSASTKEKVNKLTNSVFYTDMFEIMISIFILILTFVNGCLEEKVLIIDIIIYYLIFVLLINMLVLLKRFYVIIYELCK